MHQPDHDGDTEMISISTTVDQVATSLRELRNDFQYDDGDILMEDVCDQHCSPHHASPPLRIIVIDTNILIGHLNLLEWVAEILILARQLGKGSGYRCGLMIPKMVRAELDKHKMPHNKQQVITALLEPFPSNPNRANVTSIHSPEGIGLRNRAGSGTSQGIRVSLLEAANQAIKWMIRLNQNTPSSCRVLEFQTKLQVADFTLLSLNSQSGLKVPPDTHILDCALYFKRQVEGWGGGVALLTNDRALSLEAQVEGVPTLRVEPGVSAQTLLYYLDPILADEIDKLVAQVSVKNMTTWNWYRQTKLPLPSPSKTPQLGLIEADSPPLHQPSFSVQAFQNDVDHLDGSAVPMAIEIDEDSASLGSPTMPFFPTVSSREMVIRAPLPAPGLLHLHQHIKTAVAFMLRKRLFDCMLQTIAHGHLAVLFKKVQSVLELRQNTSSCQISQDPNKWSALDCLVLIDECWVDGTMKLFEEPIKSPNLKLQSIRPSSESSKPHARRPLASRWATTVPQAHTVTTDSEANRYPHSQRLSRLRVTVQVLKTQLRPYSVISLPRDNPLSWSILFWESLIENISEIVFHGKFHETLSDDGVSSEAKEDSFKLVIRNWKNEAAGLCPSK